jgi:hypothetical protein
LKTHIFIIQLSFSFFDVMKFWRYGNYLLITITIISGFTDINTPWMYVCIRGGPEIQHLHHDLQWSIVLPLLINPLLILHFEWSVGLYLWEHHNSHLTPQKILAQEYPLKLEMCCFFF